MINRRGFALCALLGAAALALGGCGENQSGGRKVEELRYRLMVEVDTPEGLKSGSSVIAVRAVKNPDWLTPEGRGYRYSFKGEAVAVDLPGGRTLFALVSGGQGGDASEYPWFAFGDRLASTQDPLEQMQMMRGWQGQTAAMTGTQEAGKAGQPKPAPRLPMLVTFKDIADPKSVERVEPDALDKAFGPGVKLKAVSVTVTDEPVTVGIEERFSWWENYENRQLDGHRYNNSRELANNLNRLSLKNWGN
jgi:hypothetical protein